MLTPAEVINAYFLETRCQLLEIGAMLDRVDRSAAGSPGDLLLDQRLAKIYQSLRLLAEPAATPDRAERLLHLFSDPV